MRRAQRDEQFRDFYFREMPRLRRIALLMVGDGDRAEDLAHDALLRAYRRWGRIRNEDPGPYVRTALINLCRNHHRRRGLEKRHLAEVNPDLASPDETRRVDDTLRVAHALQVLSPVRRAAIVLRFYDDMTEAEVARTLDRPLNTVKSDVRRALSTLREALDDTREEASDASR